MIDSGAEDAQGTPTQIQISPSILLYEESSLNLKPGPQARAVLEARVHGVGSRGWLDKQLYLGPGFGRINSFTLYHGNTSFEIGKSETFGAVLPLEFRIQG